MGASTEIRQRIAYESARRARLAVPVVASGVVYLLSATILDEVLRELPTVGVVQGLEPALRGEGAPAVSPRAGEVSYIDHHAFPLIASNVLLALAMAALTLVLLFLVDCTRARRPDAWGAARVMVLIGGIGYAALSLIHEVALVVQAHKFVSSHNFSNAAVEKALLGSGTAGIALQLVGLLAALALTVAMIGTMVGAMRAGLLPRWMSWLGIVSGLLFLPIFNSPYLQLLPTFWLFGTGVLLMGRFPGGDPPAWAAGEARPWPTQAEMRAQREAEQGNSRGRQTSNGIATAADLGPAPQPAGTGSRRKRRKRS